MLGAINRGIRSYDNFGVPLNLNIRQQQEYKSVCGGVLSVFMTVVLIYVFVTGVIGVFQRNAYTIEIQQLQDMDPDLKEMNSNNFMFAIQLNNPFIDHFPNLTAFQITMNQMQVETLSNGTKTKTNTKQFNLESCTSDHFPSINFEEEFNQIKSQLKNYLCLPKDYQLFLQGTYNSQIMQYPKLSVSLCTSENCYSHDDVMELAKDSSVMVSISTIIQSAIFQGNSTDNPLFYYLNSDFFLSTNLYTESTADIFFESNSIVQQNSILSFYSDEQVIDYWVFPIYSYREIKISHNEPSSLFSINFRMSQEFQQTTKRVNTIDLFLSYFGGMIKIISMIFGILALQYNQIGLRISLANALYEFNVPKKKDGRIEFSYDKLLGYIQCQINRVDEMIEKLKSHTMQIVKMSKISRALSMKHPLLQMSNGLQGDNKINVIEQTEANQENIEKFSSSLQEVKENFLSRLFNEIINQNKKLKLGFNFILYQLLCCPCIEKIAMMRKMLSQCEQVILKDLDIVNILQKLQEIEKLKQAVLEKEQIKVFNYSPKPIINIEPKFKFTPNQDGQENKLFEKFNEHKHNHQLIGIKSYNNPRQLLKIYKSYAKLKEGDHPIDQRIIKLMGPAMEQILGKYYELQMISNHHFPKPPTSPSKGDHQHEITPQFTDKLISEFASPSPGNENIVEQQKGKEHQQIMPKVLNDQDFFFTNR